MKSRVDVNRYRGTAMARALFTMTQEVKATGLDPLLLELVKIRASQLNGCAYCIDMHTKDARALGETEQRLYALNAWRETPFFSDRERAALEWTEAVTRLGHPESVPDELFARVSQVFDEDSLIGLTFAVVVINSWNRLSVAFRPPVGSYQPATAHVTAPALNAQEA